MTIRTLLISLAMAVAPSLASADDTTPTVSNQTRYARGATMAFFRITCKANGSAIKERGICYATHQNPTIDDNTCTTTIAFEGGSAYWLKNLEPSTRYYARGYAKDANGNVGYSDVRRFFTLPKGKISVTVRTDGDAAAVERIRTAANTVVDLWNNLTSIWGFYPNIGHNSGTPTADCSYGGYTRVGSNTSYQKAGTVLHEWLHGVGVGTHWIWYNNADMRANTSSGEWLGERATDAVRFIQNNETAQLKGDGTHMWPYGINGAHEDNGTDALYVSGSLVCQALGEDGLPASTGMGFATPYDAFDYEDGVKYYMRSEDKGHGLYSSFLKEQHDGSLRWVDMTTTEATANDSAAWMFSYDPATCYYYITNAATGHYVFYSGVFKCAAMDEPKASARLQLLRGRVASVDGFSGHGYFIASNQHQWNSPVLSASDNGATKTGAFSFSNSATADRWLILTAGEAAMVEKLGLTNNNSTLDDLLQKLEALLATPHREDASATDATLRSEIAAIRSEAAAATDVTTLETLAERAYDAATAFLAGVTATDSEQPFDITFLLANPEMESTADGWSDTPTLNYFCAEYYQKTFDISQTIQRKMPKGYYRAKVQAFQRPGSYKDTYNAYSVKKDSIPVTTELYITQGTVASSKAKGTAVKNIWDDAQTVQVGTGKEASMGSLYVPDNMQSAAAYFDKGLYDNEHQYRQYTNITTQGLKVGLHCTSQSSGYWSIFRNFRLYYLGSQVVTDGISAPAMPGKGNGNGAQAAKKPGVYSLDGQLVRSDASSLDGLPRGIYIVNGRKVVK